MDHKAKRAAYRERAGNLAHGRMLAERNKELTKYGGAKGNAVYTGTCNVAEAGEARYERTKHHKAREQKAPSVGNRKTDGYREWLAGMHRANI